LLEQRGVATVLGLPRPASQLAIAQLASCAGAPQCALASQPVGDHDKSQLQIKVQLVQERMSQVSIAIEAVMHGEEPTKISRLSRAKPSQDLLGAEARCESEEKSVGLRAPELMRVARQPRLASFGLLSIMALLSYVVRSGNRQKLRYFGRPGTGYRDRFLFALAGFCESLGLIEICPSNLLQENPANQASDTRPADAERGLPSLSLSGSPLFPSRLRGLEIVIRAILSSAGIQLVSTSHEYPNPADSTLRILADEVRRAIGQE